MTAPFLIVGGDGLFGAALTNFWRGRAREVIATSRREPGNDGRVVRLDLAADTDTWPVLPQCRAAVLCAGATSLERCRHDPEATRRINVEHTLELAQRLAEQDCFVVFISSNLVFDGSHAFVSANAPAQPRTEYGRQKADLEAGAAALGDRACIVRITKVMYPGHPLLSHWAGALRGGTPVSAFAEMVCAPITLDAVVMALARIADHRRTGIWQLSAARDMTYADIARQIARTLRRDEQLVRPLFAPYAAASEHLPAHTTLDATRSHAELGFDIPDPDDTITRSITR